MNDDDKSLNARVEALLNNPRGCFGPNGEELPCDTGISCWSRLGLVVSNFAMGSAYLIIRTAAASCRPTPQYLGRWAWNHRNGQVWQADIERAVYEFQEPPRDFVNDLGLCRRELWPKIRERLFEHNRCRTFGDWEWNGFLDLSQGPADDWFIDIQETVSGDLPFGETHHGTPERAIVAAFIAVYYREGGAR